MEFASGSAMKNQYTSESGRRSPNPTSKWGIVGLACFSLAACQTELELSSEMAVTSPDLQLAQTLECNRDGEPTWEDPIDRIMQARCVSCHDYCGSYETIQEVLDNGQLKSFTERGHKIRGQDQTDLLRWIEILAPETDCDVPGPDCGDGSCAAAESCASCPEDCDVPSGSVCCDQEIVAGDCCSDDDCPAGQVCMYEECTPEPASIGCRAHRNVGSDAAVGLALLIGLAGRRRKLFGRRRLAEPNR
jgi:hypothetical protein